VVTKERVPAGFENLEEQEVENYIDVYYLGRPIATAWVKYDKDYIQILNLDEILDKMDGLKDKPLIRSHLSKRIKNNYKKSCPVTRSKPKKKSIVGL
jgi:hypothetical protein